MRRGQISFDFLVIVVFAFIIFLEMFQLYALESRSSSIIEGKACALSVGSKVARTINEVLKANETSAVVTIPETLDTVDTYYLSIKAAGRRVDVFWPVSTQNASVSVGILTNNTTEIGVLKSNTSGSTSLNITNLDGFINIAVMTCGDGFCSNGETQSACCDDCGCPGDQYCCWCNFPGTCVENEGICNMLC